tara:strand:+ start:354 stop:614 length:261 start_codon:yes stop_codon:yes gene_type:complete
MLERSKYYYDTERNKPVGSTPHYYKGMVYGYKAFDIIEDYKLSYNCASALAYILRNERKHSTPIDCLSKAIEHLKNELYILQKKNK